MNMHMKAASGTKNERGFIPTVTRHGSMYATGAKQPEI